MKKLKDKKLLILAGADVHVKLVHAAKALGVYTIVTDYLEPEESPAKLVADEFWMLNITDVDAIVEKCREQNVDGVLTYCIDPAQIPYQQICEKLDLPCYGTKQQFEIMTDKRLFKNFCLENGVEVVPEYSLWDIQNDKVKYPVLVKPTVSRGSRGQTICYNSADIPQAVEIAKRESKNEDFLIERYMVSAQDMSFAYFVTNGTPYLLKLGDRYLGRPEDNLDRQHMATIMPSTHVEEIIEKVNPNIERMIQSLGIQFGSVFLQGFYEDGHVYMYDPGLRFPGSDFDIITKEITHFDPITSFVIFALTGDVTTCVGNPSNAYLYDNGACLILSLSVRAGIIKSFDGFDTISNLPYVYSSQKRRMIEEIVENTGDVRQRAAEFCVFIQNREDVPKFVRKVYDTIRIVDEYGDDMVVSKVKNI